MPSRAEPEPFFYSFLQRYLGQHLFRDHLRRREKGRIVHQYERLKRRVRACSLRRALLPAWRVECHKGWIRRGSFPECIESSPVKVALLARFPRLAVVRTVPNAVRLVGEDARPSDFFV